MDAPFVRTTWTITATSAPIATPTTRLSHVSTCLCRCGELQSGKSARPTTRGHLTKDANRRRCQYFKSPEACWFGKEQSVHKKQAELRSQA